MRMQPKRRLLGSTGRVANDSLAAGCSQPALHAHFLQPNSRSGNLSIRQKALARCLQHRTRSRNAPLDAQKSCQAWPPAPPSLRHHWQQLGDDHLEGGALVWRLRPAALHQCNVVLQLPAERSGQEQRRLQRVQAGCGTPRVVAEHFKSTAARCVTGSRRTQPRATHSNLSLSGPGIALRAGMSGRLPPIRQPMICRRGGRTRRGGRRCWVGNYEQALLVGAGACQS